MANFIQVTTTVDSRDNAEEIAQSLVTERLVACAQVMGPITTGSALVLLLIIVGICLAALLASRRRRAPRL